MTKLVSVDSSDYPPRDTTPGDGPPPMPPDNFVTRTELDAAVRHLDGKFDSLKQWMIATALVIAGIVLMFTYKLDAKNQAWLMQSQQQTLKAYEQTTKLIERIPVAAPPGRAESRPAAEN